MPSARSGVDHRPAGRLVGVADVPDRHLGVEASGLHRRCDVRRGAAGRAIVDGRHSSSGPPAPPLRQRLARRHDVDLLAGGEVALVVRVCRRRAEHVDVAADDRAAGVVGLEPAAVDRR